MSKEQDMVYLLAQIGHEIRTPLNAVKGFGEMLLDETLGELNPQQKKYLTKMLDSSEQLLHIVEMILQWAKFENNQIVLTKQKFNLGFLLMEATELFAISMKEKGLHLQLNLQENVFFDGDRDKLREVFVNLFSNACKFTPQDGNISVKLEQNINPIPQIQICICDSGCGIGENEVEKIFLPFYKTKVKNEGGTGLGLWIAKTIIEMHEGAIAVQSRKNEGTCFYITLPSVIN